MSGTSMDGIDIALVETDGHQDIRRGPSGFVPYDSQFRQLLEAGLEDARSIARRDERPGRLSRIEDELTARHTEAVREFLKDHSIDAGSIDVIGFHGQTVLHRPADYLTVQLGKGEILAENTGIPVVYDMR